MRGDDSRQEPQAGLSDRALWQHSCALDFGEAEGERFLDLAGFADNRLDPDDRERVAEWLAGDPYAADDIAAAQSLAAGEARPEDAPNTIVARACALVDRGEPKSHNVIPFLPSRRHRPGLHSVARWGSLAAAMAVASWLGFMLGMDTSLSVAQISQAGDDGFLREMLDPSAGFMRDLTEGSQT